MLLCATGKILRILTLDSCLFDKTSSLILPTFFSTLFNLWRISWKKYINSLIQKVACFTRLYAHNLPLKFPMVQIFTKCLEIVDPKLKKIVTDTDILHLEATIYIPLSIPLMLCGNCGQYSCALSFYTPVESVSYGKNRNLPYQQCSTYNFHILGRRRTK